MSEHETPAETIRRADPVSEHDEPKTALTRLLGEHTPMWWTAWKAEATLLFDGMQDLGRALGLPLGTLVTGPEAVKAAEALKARADAAPEATETVEWAVRAEDGRTAHTSEETARDVARCCADWTLGPDQVPVVAALSRTRTRYADRVTEWVPVDRAADDAPDWGAFGRAARRAYGAMVTGPKGDRAADEHEEDS